MAVFSSSTLAAPVTLSGVGLFTGAPASLTIRPGAPGSGIGFQRTDLGGPERDRVIPALATHVVPESRRTVLAADPIGVREAMNAGGPGAAGVMAAVQTVEHLLSALAGLGVRDALVEIDGPEVPIGDGSAGPFVEALLPALGDAAPAEGATIVVREPVRIVEDGSVVEALPLSPSERAAAESGAGPAGFLSYHLDYSNFPIGALASAACRRVPAQRASIALPLTAAGAGRDEYARSVAPARTFCLAEEAQAMRRAGLFAHLTARDMLVIGDDGPIDNAFRFVGADGRSDEPARHKLLDLVGDLSLAGRPIVGRIVATRSGHAQNHEMARRLMAL